MNAKELDSSINEYKEQYKSSNYVKKCDGIWLLGYKKSVI